MKLQWQAPKSLHLVALGWALQFTFFRPKKKKPIKINFCYFWRKVLQKLLVIAKMFTGNFSKFVQDKYLYHCTFVSFKIFFVSFPEEKL